MRENNRGKENLPETGKAALVTGGGRRIGQAVVLDLSQRGWDIALHYHNSESEALKTRDQVVAMGNRCEIFHCNLADEEDAGQLIPQVLSSFPHLQLLVNNASIFERATLSMTDPALLRRHLDINFVAPFILTRDFALHVGRGLIINIADTKVSENFTPYFAYTLSKKLLADFTAMAAKELGPGIRVNAVCPGLILPPSGEDENYLKRRSASLPLKQWGHVSDVTAAIQALIDQTFITGVCLYVDGGEHL
ncbi:MAG TPA: SDR family oxidoreductase [Thermoanaerobaculia bacterium]|nr:SDR family oxidoreductase [Thermoanaerobaculia bacterium]HUM28769.1 SDR family oxidoreductase [Thermoanaerobaculia bacterium]HXK67981.1 SDR family oxidoreductase [Thermoanaerobaculia bacterium]